MSATYEWDVPFLLTTPVGTLPINQAITIGTTHYGFLVLDKAGCSSQRSLRVTRKNRPQSSGEIPGFNFAEGYEMTLKAEFWETIGLEGKPLCDAKLVALSDLLQLHLNSILGDDPTTNESGRIQWAPSGAAVDRMHDNVRVIADPVGSDDGIVAVTFSLLSPFPYALDAPQTITHITSTATVINRGTSPMFPVVKVNGPTTSFNLINHSIIDANGNPLQILFDSGLPGGTPISGGHYAEIAMFSGTVYLDGNSTNLKPCIDITQSDFFPLVCGPNNLELVGAPSADILWQNAYS